MSRIGQHKFADLILGISQKLCYTTSSPDNEWRAIAPVRTHTHQYLFRCAIIAHAILCMRSQSHYNPSHQSFSLRGILQQPLLASVYCHLGGRNENQSCKDFCPIKNKWTNCLHISAQQTDKLMIMMMMMNFFVARLTNKRRLASFRAGTIVGDPHHRESLTHYEQNFKSCAEPEFKLY